MPRKIRILIVLLILGLVGGFSGVLFSLARSSGGGVPRASLAEDLAVRQAAGGYLQAWQDQAPERMYVYLSRSDRELVSPDEYQKHFEAFPVFPQHFKLGAIKLLAADKASIKVRVMWPEMSEEKMLDREEQLILVKENDVWRIREDESLN
ncbi:hypothetical protein NO1_2063 [Candidatus Termititenax aidoneus]|uniref:DUF4878 domain-containing protein n=1 Tax=Termititenax aidoneus TaxID=2218524 RepID=A0A388TDH1_TERA1|nr:hypothetical protein NO1_2063 [Candidatus Termititenax aidoneus]